MRTELKLQQPLTAGDRTIVPVVREMSFCHESGMAGEIRPVALLIGEDGSWGIALLEGDSPEEIVSQLRISGSD